MPRYLVTSALPYANGPLHFGHMVGAYLPADVYVRTLRMQGEDVRFVLRRMVIFAAEDVGNADPQALQLAVAALSAFDLVG